MSMCVCVCVHVCVRVRASSFRKPITEMTHAKVNCRMAMAGSRMGGSESLANEALPHMVCSTSVLHVTYLDL